MTTAVSQASKPTLGTVWRNGLIAIVVAAVANAVLYFVGAALGWMPDTVLTPMGLPVTIVPVVASTVIALVVATIVYSILNRFTGNPNRWFTIIAVIVLVVSAVSPLSLPGAPTMMIVLLEVMHVVAGISAIYFLRQSQA
ncbi:MAG: DUF6069 family protein [Caldilineaceae bacterium]